MKKTFTIAALLILLAAGIAFCLKWLLDASMPNVLAVGGLGAALGVVLALLIDTFWQSKN